MPVGIGSRGRGRGRGAGGRGEAIKHKFREGGKPKREVGGKVGWEDEGGKLGDGEGDEGGKDDIYARKQERAA